MICSGPHISSMAVGELSRMSTVSRSGNGQPAGSPRAVRDQSGEGGATAVGGVMLGQPVCIVLEGKADRIVHQKKSPLQERAKSIFLEENRGDRSMMLQRANESKFFLMMSEITGMNEAACKP